jgi:benzodiazapine receptor
MSTFRQVTGLAVSILICFTAAGVGGLLTRPAIEGWYSTLRKPAWTPPNWIFGPVWSALYLAMAVAVWLVWRKAGLSGAKLALALFGLQLLFNVGWSAIFFGLRLPGPAFAEIVILWLLILATTVAFWPISSMAGGLMVPYLLWVMFAAALNFAIWRLNA